MISIRVVVLSLAVCALLSTICAPVRAVEVHDEAVKIPKSTGLFGVTLTAYLYKPPGDGPFPLVVINHGKAPGNPAFQQDNKYYRQSLEFVKRGYVVILPVRQGFGTSGGQYVQGCGLDGLGRTRADDIAVAINYAKTLPYVDPAHIVVIGQSQGGITTAAFGVRNMPGVLGIVNLVGGERMTNCANWESSDLEAFRSYGAESTVPALFMYGDNDSFWGDGTLAHQFFEAYHAGNPNAKLIDFGVFPDGDSHRMFASKNGRGIWIPAVGDFFQSLGLNWDVKYQIDGAGE